MIIPNYTNFKAGLCTDMEFFKFSYAGKDGQVIKRNIIVDKKRNGKHTFYAIKRPIEPVYGRPRCEFKVYDLCHHGPIEKEVITEDKSEGIEIPSLTSWFMKLVETNMHMRDYIAFCRDSNLVDK